MSDSKLLQELSLRMAWALEAKDEQFLSRLAVFAGLRAPEGWFEAECDRLLTTLPHDVQQFWLDDCNCDGHLN